MSGRDCFVEMDVRSVEAYELAREWFDEVVFTKKLVLDNEPDWDALKEELRELRGTYGKVAVLLVTRKPSLIRAFKARNLRVLLYVQGGDMRVNRTAIEAKVPLAREEGLRLRPHAGWNGRQEGRSNWLLALAAFEGEPLREGLNAPLHGQGLGAGQEVPRSALHHELRREQVGGPRAEGLDEPRDKHRNGGS